MDAHALDFGEEGSKSDKKAACAPRVGVDRINNNKKKHNNNKRVTGCA